jgi:hypothetical protein
MNNRRNGCNNNSTGTKLTPNELAKMITDALYQITVARSRGLQP